MWRTSLTPITSGPVEKFCFISFPYVMLEETSYLYGSLRVPNYCSIPLSSSFFFIRSVSVLARVSCDFQGNLSGTLHRISHYYSVWWLTLKASIIPQSYRIAEAQLFKEWRFVTFYNVRNHKLLDEKYRELWKRAIKMPNTDDVTDLASFLMSMYVIYVNIRYNWFLLIFTSIMIHNKHWLCIIVFKYY